MPSVLASTCSSQTEELRREKAEPDPLLGSQETRGEQNGEWTVTVPPEDGKMSKAGPTDWLSRVKGWSPCWAVLLIIIFVLIIIFTAPLAKKHESSPADPVYTVAACPNGWVGYLGECYYFSEDEGNWTSSLSNCSAHGASLVGINTPQEMDFMMRYKGPSDYWIGLQRDPGQPWKWTNGTEFNHWFDIQGNENCAFMSHGGISSAGCSGKRPWVCRKPEKKTEKEQ